MIQSKIEKIIIYILTLSLILIYLTDGISKFFIQLSGHYISILPNRYVKVFLVFLSISFSFLMLKRMPNFLYKSYLLLISLLLINLFNKIFYGQSFDYFLKYSCFFFFTPLFFFKGQDELWINYVDRIFKYLVYFNFALVILGILYDIQLFKTYYTRFGYNGLLLTSMQSTYFYMSAILIALNRKDSFFFSISVLSALLIGTKVLLAFLGCFSLWIIFNRIKNYKIKTLLIFVLGLIFFLAMWFFFNQEIFKSIIENEGILAAVFSYRNELFVSVWNDLPQINYNFITGGVSLSQYRVEMGFIDVFLYFGILGIIIFIILFYIIKNYFVINKITYFYFFIVLFFISIAGNFLYYPINCFIFLITLKSLGIKRPLTKP